MEALVIYLAGLALIAAVSWAVARPFFRPPAAEVRDHSSGRPGRSRWERQKDEALAAIRDAEFDFQLGKLSKADYRELRSRLEREALEAIRRLEGEEPGR